MLFLLALVLQPKSADICHRFPAADVAVVLGAKPSKPGASTVPGACTWTAAGITLTISSTDVHDPGAAAALVGASRSGARSGETVTDERGIGPQALSIAARSGKSVQILNAAGSVIWRYDVESADKPLNMDATLTHLRQLVHKGS
jgi:hypothetical protein